MNKKWLALMLAIITIASIFTACSTQATTETHEPVTQTTTQIEPDTTSFKLSYSQSDSLNPFESESLNNQVLENLVFESLFTLDESYEVQPSIATGYTYTDSTTLTVTIPSGLVFSDGTVISVSDVVRSFNEAQVSPHWKNSLSVFKSATAISDNTVQFNMNYANPNAQNLLTFAIAKNDNDKNGYPIGSGKYKFGASNGDVYLEVNENYSDFSPRFTKIKLINITNAESIENAINIGNITYAYRDLSDGDSTRMQCNKKMVNLNNLVYIGANGFTGITSNANIRKAISLAIDRDTLVKSSYQGYAKSATSIFNPSSTQGKETAVFSSTADTAGAKQAIAQSGYDTKKLKLTILVSNNTNRVAAAQLIKQQLEAVGFEVTINKQSAKKYADAVSKRSFDLYIGETKITNDMNLSSFFSTKGATSYGIDLENSKTAVTYDSYLNSKTELGKFMIDFTDEMPFIPVLYRQGMICYSKSLHGDMQGYVDNYFSNIQDWYCN
jgi:peptide/nickel transport system substrate-binding protein